MHPSSKLAILDYETEAAVSGTAHPPRPVGVALDIPGETPYYLAWGHPTENNCTATEAAQRIRTVHRKYAVVCHNAKFDWRISQEWIGVTTNKGVHDTLFLAYLLDPRRRSLELKVLADEDLGLPPDEQEELHQWLCDHYPPAKRAKKNWGKYISKAPGALVGRYAVGDVVRTRGLFDEYYPVINADEGLRRSYERERRLLPAIIHMERRGMDIKPEVHEANDKFQAQLDALDNRIHRKLGDISIGHPQSVYGAALAKGLVDESQVEYTTKGNPRTGRDFVANWCTDRKLVADLSRRSKLVKIVGTYLRPWAEAPGGVFYAYYNQTRGTDDGGTRTGRLSSNFQQVPREVDDPTLPFLRRFIWSGSKNTDLVLRDYSSQEIRILAHYAEGALLAAFIENPGLDVHEWVRQLIYTIVGVLHDRSHVKQVNFLQIYGGGAPALSLNIAVSMREARDILSAHRKALPEVKELSSAVTAQLKEGVLLRTWGGRLYDVEEGFSKQGRWEKLFYKMINVLIQGSAADQTKDAMIVMYDEGMDLALQVHDEVGNRVLRTDTPKVMRRMREIMNDGTGWDVPMRSDGKVGALSWGTARKWDDERERFKR